MNWSDFVGKVQAIASIGLKFSSDPYALENYQELYDLSQKMVESSISKSDDSVIYSTEKYPTPNISVRILCLNDENKLLMVQENSDGKWSIPGGWCDVYESLEENAVKECFQETGYLIKMERILAITFRDRHKPKRKTFTSEYCVYFLGKIIGGGLKNNHEINNIDFFDVNFLPELSTKISMQELEMAFKGMKTGQVQFE